MYVFLDRRVVLCKTPPLVCFGPAIEYIPNTPFAIQLIDTIRLTKDIHIFADGIDVFTDKRLDTSDSCLYALKIFLIVFIYFFLGMILGIIFAVLIIVTLFTILCCLHYWGRRRNSRKYTYTKQVDGTMGYEQTYRELDQLDPLVDVDLTGVDIMAVQVQMPQGPYQNYPAGVGVAPSPGYPPYPYQASPPPQYTPNPALQNYHNPYQANPQGYGASYPNAYYPGGYQAPPPTHPAGYSAIPTTEVNFGTDPKVSV